LALCALGLAYAVAGCADSDENDCDGIDTSAAALYGGHTDFDGDRDLAVVALLTEFDDDREDRLCSGALVGLDVVLTARHCMASDGQTTIIFGRSVDRPVSTVKVDHFVVDGLEGDLALAVFDPRSTPFIETMRLWGDYSIAVGDSVTLSGFGKDEDGRVGRLTFVRESIAELDDQTITVDGKGKTGACVGDSGGPLLVVDAETGELRPIGVLSVGSATCTDLDVYQRVMPGLDKMVQELEEKPGIDGPYGPEGPSRPYEGC
jgi:hypothetical protein